MVRRGKSEKCDGPEKKKACMEKRKRQRNLSFCKGCKSQTPH